MWKKLRRRGLHDTARDENIMKRIIKSILLMWGVPEDCMAYNKRIPTQQ